MIGRLLAMAIFLWPATSMARAGDQPFDPFGLAGVDRLPDARIPASASLTRENGRATTLPALSGGKPIVLVPVQYRCPNLCGLTLEGLALAIRSQAYVPGRDFELIVLGIDPREGPAEAREAGERLRARLGLPRGATGVAALTGADAKAVTQRLGYRYAWDRRMQQYAHIAAVAVLTPDGRLARWLYGLQPQGDDLRLALTEAGEGRLGDWAEQLLLLCYHYDPQTGRYSGVVWLLLRIGGALTLLSLAALVAIFAARERGRRSR